MTVNRFTNASSISNRLGCYRLKNGRSLLDDPKQFNSIRRKTAKWVGYILRLERQRRSLTQTHLASELGFGMSYVSTIESGNAFANIDRTLMLIHFFGINSGMCIGAIEAQITIQKLLRESQKHQKQSAAEHPRRRRSTPSYPLVVADKVIDRQDRSHASSRSVRQNHPDAKEAE